MTLLAGWRPQRPALGALALVLVLAATACTGGEPVAQPPSPSASPSPSPSTSPTPVVDAELTALVCAAAANATGAGAKVYVDQYSLLEQSAATDDQAAMVAAAEAINKQFRDLARTLTDLIQPTLSEELRALLTDVAEALTEIASVGYTGTTVDIRKKLADFAVAFGETCAPS